MAIHLIAYYATSAFLVATEVNGLLFRYFCHAWLTFPAKLLKLIMTVPGWFL